jgi:hypothetical protein
MIFHDPRAYIQPKQSFSVLYATSSVADGITAHKIANIREVGDPNLKAFL